MKSFYLFFILFLAGQQCLIGQQRIDSLQLFNDLKVVSADTMNGRRTGTEGIGKARSYIINELRQMGATAFFSDYQQKFTYSINDHKERGVNIVGYVPGDSALSIVVSAHYDHLGKSDTIVYNGADDNASGVAALLAIARYYTFNKPTHTMIFSFFDAEEQGLKGSKAFINSPSVDDDNIAININMDMIGRSEKKLFVAGTYYNSFLKEYLPQSNQSVTLLAGHDNPKKNRLDWTFASDHGPFHLAKIPFLYFGVEDHEDYHKPSDTYDKINKEFFYNASEIILEAIIGIEKNLDDIQINRLKETLDHK